MNCPICGNKTLLPAPPSCEPEGKIYSRCPACDTLFNEHGKAIGTRGGQTHGDPAWLMRARGVPTKRSIPPKSKFHRGGNWQNAAKSLHAGTAVRNLASSDKDYKDILKGWTLEDKIIAEKAIAKSKTAYPYQVSNVFHHLKTSDELTPTEILQKIIDGNL